MHIFNRIAGYTEEYLRKRPETPFKLARGKYPRPSVQELLDSLSIPNAIGFLIARHPFERLVSAYRNKIMEKDSKFSGKDKAIKDMLIKYRYRNFSRKIIEKESHEAIIPTFTQFVMYILDEYHAGKKLDMHWEPAYRFRNPCQVNLTHIIKFETFDRDTKRILEKANLSHYLPASGRIKENSSGRNTKSSCQVDKYLNELPSNLQKELYEMYKIDFDLFGYHER